MKSNGDRCSLLLRILKVYRTGIHSGYIQYTYRGFHIPHLESSHHVVTAIKSTDGNLEVRLTLRVVVQYLKQGTAITVQRTTSI